MKLIGGYLFAVLRTNPKGSLGSSSLSRCTLFGNTKISSPNRLSSSSFSVRGISMSMSTSSSKYDESTQTLIDHMKQPLPLIDVDCNLLHEDLISILQESPDTIYQDTCTNLPLRILHHPSTVASNIAGVFSPSSTIDEARTMHSILLSSTEEGRNNIDVRMSVGVHPYHAEEAGDLTEIESDVADQISTLMDKDASNANASGEHNFITCIGEAGLDYSDGFPSRDKQLPWFEFQLRCAKKYNLPLFLHERLAFDDTVALIDKVFSDDNCPPPPIIIHCFTGTKEECEKYVERGYHISVSGYVLKNGDGPEEVKSCLRDGIIPLDKLMIETDAPYMGFNTCRETFYQMEAETNAEFQALNGKKRKRLVKGIYPNVPASLPKVLDSTVSLINEGRRARGEEEVSIEEAGKIFVDNSVQFFGIRIN